ncbi:MAG TPA: phosphate signaling complex protein PhoU [Candidatus Faecousia intestinigallinarum]|nr:phosphate signaling complex protein PhoU [Candidatus Faecousia intestinigallinarum]
MRVQYDQQLQMLNRAMITMGSLCESAIAKSSQALLLGDLALADQATEISAEISQKEREIENMCLKLLLQQQPVARDLRVVSSALKMVTDMERIGHQSADIAEIIRVAKLSPQEETQDIHDMAQATIQMVTNAIDAFVHQDVAGAKAVMAYDDVVDGYFDKIKKNIIRHLQNPELEAEYAVDLLMIAKYFERIGDHAVNIAGWVCFSISGSREEWEG